MSNFRFVVIGDSQGYTHGVNQKVLRELLAQVSSLSPQPSFLLFTGDLIEGDGEIIEELYYWRQIVTDYYPISMIYPAIGNHNPNEKNFAKVFAHLPNNGPAGYHRTVYRFNYGNSRFFCLNSNRDQKIDSNQRAWLKKHLQHAPDQGIEHSFVFFHKPAYPVGRHLGSSLDYHPYFRNIFWKIIDHYQVDLVFNGHEHNYCRRRIDSAMNTTLEGEEFIYENSVYQLICGGGGAELGAETYCMDNVEVGPVMSYHYVVVDVSADLVNVNVYDPDNNLLDAFYLRKPDNAAEPDKKKKFFLPWFNQD